MKAAKVKPSDKVYEARIAIAQAHLALHREHHDLAFGPKEADE